MENCVCEKRMLTLKEYEKEKGKLENREAVRIAKMISRTLEELHRKKRVYRELCPENIVLIYEEKENSDCLTEVRLEENAAQRQYRNGATEDTVFMGITRYAAPEQYGFAQSVPATDIFAIGVILNEMLTGKTPEEEKTADKGCRYIIEKCCELDWKKRYQNIQSLRKDLDYYLMYGEKNGIFLHAWKYRKLAGKGILLGAVCIFILIFIGRFLQKGYGADRNRKFSVEKQEDMKQKEEALSKEYQKYVLEDEEIEIYYPRGFHYLRQEENQNGTTIWFSEDTGEFGMFGVMVANNEIGYTKEYFVEYIMGVFDDIYHGTEILHEEDGETVVYHYKANLNEKDTIFGLHCTIDQEKEIALVTFAVFFEEKKDEYYKYLSTVLQKITFLDS